MEITTHFNDTHDVLGTILSSLQRVAHSFLTIALEVGILSYWVQRALMLFALGTNI